MEALGLNLGFLIMYVLNFAIIFVVLRAWVYKPLINMLDKRRQAVAQGLEDARVAADARANAEKEANRIISEAQVKSAEIVREATARAESAQTEVRSSAEAEIARAREEALVELAGERNVLLGELRGHVAALAVAAAQKLIGEALDEKRQRVLLDEFFSGIRGGKVVVVESESGLTGQSAEITSALPLTAEEQETVRKDILVRLGGAATVTFVVDPTILGGLVVRVGDRVVDGSVAGQLSTLGQSLR